MCLYPEKTSGLLVLLLTLALTCDGKITRNELPGPGICGRPSIRDYSTRIINGEPAKLGEFPWMARIGYDIGTKISWTCAGSLISDRYVVSVAHCLVDFATNIAKVRLGELDFDPSVDDKATPKDYSVEKMILNNFNVTLNDNDIGLIKLKDKVIYTDLIRPICLPPPEFQGKLFVHYNPTIAGWGTTENGENNTRLLKAEVEIKDTASCRTNITSVPKLRYSIIDHRVLCASAPDKDSCAGDSGGPMMIVQKSNGMGADPLGNYFLLGIISYGHECALEGYPGVYTRVSEFMSWILDNVD